MGLQQTNKWYSRIVGGLSPVTPQPAQTVIPYSDFGFHPGAAQAAQSAVYPNPHLNPQPQWTTDQVAVANWFTTRVHLAPLGKV